eukprot:gene8523-10262_t
MSFPAKSGNNELSTRVSHGDHSENTQNVHVHSGSPTTNENQNFINSNSLTPHQQLPNDDICCETSTKPDESQSSGINATAATLSEEIDTSDKEEQEDRLSTSRDPQSYRAAASESSQLQQKTCNSKKVESSNMKKIKTQLAVVNAYMYFDKEKELHLLGSHSNLGCINTGTKDEKWQPDDSTLLEEFPVNEMHSIYYRRFQVQYEDKDINIEYKFAHLKNNYLLYKIVNILRRSNDYVFQIGGNRNLQLDSKRDVFLFSGFNSDGQHLPQDARNSFGMFLLETDNIIALAELICQLTLNSPNNILFNETILHAAKGKQFWQLLMEISQRTNLSFPQNLYKCIQEKIITDISIVHELFDTADVRTGDPPIEDILSLLKHSSYNDFRFLLLLKSLDC